MYKLRTNSWKLKDYTIRKIITLKRLIKIIICLRKILIFKTLLKSPFALEEDWAKAINILLKANQAVLNCYLKDLKEVKMNFKPYIIGRVGERAVMNWLARKGWEITRWDTQAPGSTDIEAQSGNKKLLIQVKSAVYPNQPSSLSWAEKRNIKSRAARIGAEPWEARVLLDKNLNLMYIIMALKERNTQKFKSWKLLVLFRYNV